MDDNEAYVARMEEIAREYAPRALALLERIRQECISGGLGSPNPPCDMSDDEYRWSLTVYRFPDTPFSDDDMVDITIEMAEQREYDGDGNGVSFGISIAEWGGRELGRLQPYNYTSEVWVDSSDSEAVRDRWNILENSDISQIPDLI